MRFGPTNPKAVRPGVRSAVTKAAKPAPRTPAPVNPGGNVVNKGRPTFLRSHGLPPSGVRAEIPTPVNPGTGGRNLADAILGRTPPAGGGATSVNNIGSPGFPRARAEIPTPMKKGNKVKAAKARASLLKKGGAVKKAAAKKGKK